MVWRIALGLSFVVSVLGCSPQTESTNSQAVAQPVRVVMPVVSETQQLTLSGIVRARTEVELAFEVPGRIAQREVQAGALVTEGQALYRLDLRDLQQRLAAQQANLAAAEAALATAEQELQRVQQLRADNLVSESLFDQAQLQQQQAARQVDASQAQLQLAEKALADGVLRAPAAGTVLELRAEQNQVVASGQPVLLFAYAEQTEIEVLLPPLTLQQQGQAVFQQGQVMLADGSRVGARLRELDGAVSASARTLRARYALDQNLSMPLRSVVKIEFADAAQALWQLPLSAIDGRCSEQQAQACEQMQVWQVVDNRAEPLAISVEQITGEYALVRGALSAEMQIIAAGTHLLTRSQAVRVLPQ